MTGYRVAARRATTRSKLIALAAGAAVLATGGIVTSLAAWTDTEYVHGGTAPGTGGVSASVFEVEQNVTGAADGSGWTNDLASPGGLVDFGEIAQQLSPDTTVTGFVRLRTVVDSLAGHLSLVSDTAAATVADEDSLAHVLGYRAWVESDAFAAGFVCDEAPDAGDTVLVGSAAAFASLDTAGSATFDLAAGTDDDPGAERTVCFALTMPAGTSDDYQTAPSFDPIWHFAAQSFVAP